MPKLGRPANSLLAAAFEADVPIYTSSPGDSSIGMNLAALSLQGGKLQIDTLRDVNETAALVYAAKRAGNSGVLILGGGSPKNFILQTEPQIQEVLGLSESGHDYFLQITDARPDTGGLSGATASEAMTWGKVDPDTLPDSVTCYTDTTIALPLLSAYALRGTRRDRSAGCTRAARPTTTPCWPIMRPHGGRRTGECGAGSRRGLRLRLRLGLGLGRYSARSREPVLRWLSRYVVGPALRLLPDPNRRVALGDYSPRAPTDPCLRD